MTDLSIHTRLLRLEAAMARLCDIIEDVERPSCGRPRAYIKTELELIRQYIQGMLDGQQKPPADH